MPWAGPGTVSPLRPAPSREGSGARRWRGQWPQGSQCTGPPRTPTNPAGPRPENSWTASRGVARAPMSPARSGRLPSDATRGMEDDGDRTAGARRPDLTGRLRGRPRAEVGYAAGSRRRPPAQVGVPARWVPPSSTSVSSPPGRRGRRHDHGPHHVRSRPRSLGRRGLDRVVGRRAALRPRRLRAQPPRTAPAGYGRRDAFHVVRRRHRGSPRPRPLRGRGRPRAARRRGGDGAGVPPRRTCSTRCTSRWCRCCRAPGSGCSATSPAPSTAGAAWSSSPRRPLPTCGSAGRRRAAARNGGDRAPRTLTR